MDYKLNLITPSLYSKAGSSNFQDSIVEKFAHYLKYRSDTEFNLKCKFDPVPGLAFIHSFEDFEERFLIHSEYAIIIASPASQKALNQFIPRLLVFLTSKPIWQNRFIFVILGKVKVLSNLVVNEPIEFSVDNWENDDEESWIRLFDLIKVKWEPHVDKLVPDSSPNNKLHVTENDNNDPMVNYSQISEFENNENRSLNFSQKVETTNLPDPLSVIQHKPLEFENHSETVPKTTTTKTQVKNLANRSIQGSNVVLENLTFSKAESDNITNPKVFTESYANTEESIFTLTRESNENQLKQEMEQKEENNSESSQISNNDSDTYSEQSFECAPVNLTELIEENDDEGSDDIQINKIYHQHQEVAEDPVSDFLYTKPVRTEGNHIDSSLAEIKSDGTEVSIESIRSNPDDNSKTLISNDVNSVKDIHTDKNILNFKSNSDDTKDKNINKRFDLNVDDVESENIEISPKNLTNILEEISRKEVNSVNKINLDKISQLSKVNEKGLEGAEDSSNNLSTITGSCLLTSMVSDLKGKETPGEISEENINSAKKKNESQLIQKGTEEKENTSSENSSVTINDKCLRTSNDSSLKEKENPEIAVKPIIRSIQYHDMLLLYTKDTEEKESTSKEIAAEHSGAHFEDIPHSVEEYDLLHKNENGTETKKNISNEILGNTIKDTSGDSCLIEKVFIETSSEANTSLVNAKNISQVKGKKNEISNEVPFDITKAKGIPTHNDSYLKEKEYSEAKFEPNTHLDKDADLLFINKKEESKEKENAANEISANIIKEKCLSTQDDSCLKEKELLVISSEEITNLPKDNNTSQINEKDTKQKGNTPNEILVNSIKDKCLSNQCDSCLKKEESLAICSEETTNLSKDNNMLQVNDKDTEGEENKSNEMPSEAIKVKCSQIYTDSGLDESETRDVNVVFCPPDINKNVGKMDPTADIKSVNNSFDETPKCDSETNEIFLNRNGQIFFESQAFEFTASPAKYDTNNEEYSNPNILTPSFEMEKSFDNNGKAISIRDANLQKETDHEIEDIITNFEGTEVGYSISTEYDEASEITKKKMNYLSNNEKEISSSENDIFYRPIVIENDMSKNVDEFMGSCSLNMGEIYQFTKNDMFVSSENGKILEKDSIININFEPIAIDSSKTEYVDIDIGSRITFSSVDIYTNVSGNKNQNPVPKRRAIGNIEEEIAGEVGLPNANPVKTQDIELTAGSSDAFNFRNTGNKRKAFDEIVVNEDCEIISTIGNEEKQFVEHFGKTNVRTNQEKTTNWTNSDQNFEINDKASNTLNLSQHRLNLKHSSTKRERQPHFKGSSHISFSFLSKFKTIHTFIKRIVFRENRVSSCCQQEEHSNHKEDSITRCLHSPWCVLLVFVGGTLASPYWVELTKNISQRAVEPGFLVDTIASTALHEEKVIGKYNHYF